MSIPLLATKLYVPPARPEAIPRPRLSALLREGMHRPGCFALLSGPAGCGKTTLLSEFAAQLQRPPAWVSLDEGDNDPTRFWTYLISACQSVQQGIGAGALALFHASQPIPSEAIPAILINDMAHRGEQMVLALDDFHAIQNPSIHADFQYLLEHLPERLFVLLSTRSDPPWPLARFRASNRLIEVRINDLRFTRDEAAKFLKRSMGLDLPVEQAAALEERTEGWIAGLQLAALSMRGRSDTAAFVKAFTGSHLFIAEYLVEEVIQRQPEDIQAFLLNTSILGRFNAELCEALSGSQNAQAILENLLRANLFLFPLDDAGRWFRYHHLFAELLQARLRQQMPEEAVASLHRRAAAWHARHGSVIEAVNHALWARDFDGAARLIEQNAYTLLARGELDTLLGWTEALPADLTRRRPLFFLAKAWALTFAGKVEQIEGLLGQAEAQIEMHSADPNASEVLGNAAAIRAYLRLMAGDHEGALHLAEHAERLLPAGNVETGWSSPYTLAAQSVLPYILGMGYRSQGRYELAAEAFTQEAQAYTAPEALMVWTIATIELARTRRMQGRLRESAAICLAALQRISELGAPLAGSLAGIDATLSDVLREQNALDEAYQRARGAIERAQSWVMPTDRLTCYLYLLRVQEAQGDLRGAQETLRLAKDLKTKYPVFLELERMVDLYEVRLALATQDLETAGRLLEVLQPGTSRTTFLRDQELILLARLRLAQGRAEEAEAILSSLADDAQAGGRMYAWLECLAVRACAHQSWAPEKRGAAVELLVEALAFARPEGFVRVFADQGEVMQDLLLAVIHHKGRGGSAPECSIREYAADLVEICDGSRSSERVSRPALNREGPVEELTAREMEVLNLLAAGDSNGTIAAKLVITVRTVKKHTGNIYGKLNVHSRTQAVARARQLGLLAAQR